MVAVKWVDAEEGHRGALEELAGAGGGVKSAAQEYGFSGFR